MESLLATCLAQPPMGLAALRGLVSHAMPPPPGADRWAAAAASHKPMTRVLPGATSCQNPTPARAQPAPSCCCWCHCRQWAAVRRGRCCWRVPRPSLLRRRPRLGCCGRLAPSPSGSCPRQVRTCSTQPQPTVSSLRQRLGPSARTSPQTLRAGRQLRTAAHPRGRPLRLAARPVSGSARSRKLAPRPRSPPEPPRLPRRRARSHSRSGVAHRGGRRFARR
mmetsp:Transcript_40384/g.104513  ORF Transcript_40384/g.104513 Transcript_40384/m.104513 type:complete len:221 (-) Transcript_40384:101-763(-)